MDLGEFWAPPPCWYTSGFYWAALNGKVVYEGARAEVNFSGQISYEQARSGFGGIQKLSVSVRRVAEPGQPWLAGPADRYRAVHAIAGWVIDHRSKRIVGDRRRNMGLGRQHHVIELSGFSMA
jgi:hypothetical protein